MQKEVRTVDIELRVEGEDNPKIRGHAAVFDKMSVELFGFREVIKKGAFKKSIPNADVRALFNHDPNFVLGRNKSGTLTMREDNEGLYVEIEPPNTQWSRDLQESIKRGDINQMSFGFRTVKDEWDNQTSKDVVRTLLEVELFDVSVVTYPAYPQTDVGIRSAKEVFEQYQHHIDTSQKDDDYIKNLQSKAQRSLFILQQKLNLKERI